MFGGILTSAVLTLFVVPAAFYLFERKPAGRRITEEIYPSPRKSVRITLP